jgi:hypothetical protein
LHHVTSRAACMGWEAKEGDGRNDVMRGGCFLGIPGCRPEIAFHVDTTGMAMGFFLVWVRLYWVGWLV